MKRHHLLLLCAFALLFFLSGCERATTLEEDRIALEEAVTFLELPPQENDMLAYRFSEGLSPVKRGDLWGYLDKNGEIVIEPTYTIAYGFSDGLALVLKDDLFGYIDRNGQEVIPLQYQNATIFSDGWASVFDDESWFLIDQTGAPVADFDYSQTGQTEPLLFKNGYAICSVAQPAVLDAEGNEIVSYLHGYVDKTGDIVVPVQYEEATPMSHGYAFVRLNGAYQCIDEAGNRVLADWYFNSVPIGGFSEDGFALLDVLLPSEKERCTLLINDELEVVYTLSKQQTSAGNNVYYDGLILAPNAAETKMGAFDIEGNVVIPLVLDMIGPYSDGVFEAYFAGDENPIYICNPLQ